MVADLLRKISPWLLVLILVAGCGFVATRKGFYDPITAELRAQNFEAAAAGLEEARAGGKYGKKDRLVYYLDAGLAFHYASQYDSSNARLHEAEQTAEDLFTKSISRAAASVLINDNVLEYSGEDYEVLYANLLKALNYLALDQFDDAFVEIRRANLKLELLEQKYADVQEMFRQQSSKDTSGINIDYDIKPVRFHNCAFARYLSMHMYAADGKWDDARIDKDYLEQAFHMQPFIYGFDIPDVQYDSDEGAILSVVALTGLSPVKEELNLRIRTDKDLNLVQILYTDSERKDQEYGHLPMNVSEDYYFKFAIPKLADRLSIVSHVNVYASGELLGHLQLIEDVGLVARETFKARSSLIFLRTVVRAVTKGLVAHKAKKKNDTESLAQWLKKAAIDVAVDISENADLRCARLLPGRILVGDFVLPQGEYDLTIEFIDHAGHQISNKQLPGYFVIDGKLNFVEAVCLN